MAETESKHWWFSARRSIVSGMIERLGLARDSEILEVGCGTGGNLATLARFGKVSAFELDTNAREIAAKKSDHSCDIRAGKCPDEIPFHDKRFALICLFDVLEHIDRDTETLIALKRLLLKDGRILITVPAFQWLWSSHDEYLHHKRRYTASQLRKIITDAELQPVKISYFNTILFPLAIIARFWDKLPGKSSVTGTSIPPGPINKILKTLFDAERFLLKRFNLPFGVSLICVLKAAE